MPNCSGITNVYGFPLEPATVTALLSSGPESGLRTLISSRTINTRRSSIAISSRSASMTAIK